MSLLEEKVDSCAMDVILSYLTLVDYSRLSVASKMLQETVSRSTHLYMDEYGMFRKRARTRCRHDDNATTTAATTPPLSPRQQTHKRQGSSSSLCCDDDSNTPQDELKQLMNRFRNVSVLNLQGLAPVGDDLIHILNQCPSSKTLKSITLHSCALSYWCAHSFKLPNLEHLTLTGNSIRARMTFLLQDSKNLKSLAFKQCPALRDGDIAGISKILNSSLEELVLNHTKLSKPEAAFPALQTASFAGSFCLTSLSRFACPNLRFLNLSFCVHLSERQIEKMVEQSPLLETLILVKCAGIHSLDLESKNLRRLDASFTHNLRDLLLECPALMHLDVSESSIVDFF
jgi:hypothetical protein